MATMMERRKSWLGGAMPELRRGRWAPGMVPCEPGTLMSRWAPTAVGRLRVERIPRSLQPPSDDRGTVLEVPGSRGPPGSGTTRLAPKQDRAEGVWRGGRGAFRLEFFRVCTEPSTGCCRGCEITSTRYSLLAAGYYRGARLPTELSTAPPYPLLPPNLVKSCVTT